LASAALAAAGLAALLAAGSGFAVVSQAGKGGAAMSKKPAAGTIHTRNNLPRQVEDPLEVPEPEPEAKEPLPAHRVPYSLHIVSHFPHHKHLHEESGARKAIEEKIVSSFHNFEDLIRHVEVNLQVSENFHRTVDTGKHSKHPHKRELSQDDEPIEVRGGNQMLAPYLFKVTVSLRNHRTIVLANAEKHAQPTLTEGLDHMVDVVKKSLREEKDKMIEAHKREKSGEDLLGDEAMDLQDAKLEAEELAEEMEAKADKEMEALYEVIESKQG